jgi:hypothetical protein
VDFHGGDGGAGGRGYKPAVAAIAFFAETSVSEKLASAGKGRW